MSSESARMLGGTKMFAHADRIAEWQAGRLPSPVTVELDVTNLCNHSCAGCSFGYLVNIQKDSLPHELAQRVINELAAMGVRGITFSGGGEPLVYGPDRVLALMRQATDRGLDVGLITNGSLLRDVAFLEVCQWIRVSLDGYDADTFARFHGRNDKEFAKVVSNLRAICRIKPRRSTVGAGFLTDAGSLERRDFWRMAEFCAGIDGLDYLQFRPLVTNMVADPSLTGGYEGFSPSDLSALLVAYQEARSLGHDSFKVLLSGEKYDLLSQPGFGRTYNRCLGHFLEATVAADGNVYRCCHGQGVPDFCLGDLREESFADIWHGERNRQVYESIDPSQRCPPACRLSSQNRLLHQVAGATHPSFI